MTLARITVAYTLVAAILLTSFGAGMARAMTPAVSSVVLCMGHGITTIHLDAQGNETERVHLCPDAVGSLLAFVDVAAPVAHSGAGLALRLGATEPGDMHAPELRHDGRPRGPPLGVL